MHMVAVGLVSFTRGTSFQTHKIPGVSLVKNTSTTKENLPREWLVWRTQIWQSM